jgi:feruloyl esterase
MFEGGRDRGQPARDRSGVVRVTADDQRRAVFRHADRAHPPIRYQRGPHLIGRTHIADLFRCGRHQISDAGSVLGTGQTRGTSEQPTARSAIRPRVSCGSLTTVDLTAAPDAPDALGRIISAADVTDNGLAYCDVKGYISPQTGFEVLLPETTWQGDYLREGCGGFCGRISLSLQPLVAVGCAPVADGAFVVAADDQGHQSPSITDGLWAARDPALRVVFGYSSEHSLALVAKTITAAYYGQRPAHSYFDGCSDGGHEALDLAQRYPG